jgi:hypothetical protein
MGPCVLRAAVHRTPRLSTSRLDEQIERSDHKLSFMRKLHSKCQHVNVQLSDGHPGCFEGL